MSPSTSNKYEISAPALHCAEIILRNFHITEKPESRFRATKKNLAILIDVTTNIFRVEAVIDQLVKDNPWANKHALAQNIDRLRDSIRAVELVRNRLPRFSKSESQVPFSVKQSVEREVSAEVQERMKAVATELSSARTVEDEQRVLKKAGIIR